MSEDVSEGRQHGPSGTGVTSAIVVGGGIGGLSVAWALAERGVEVDLFEQGPLPNPRSSSYDEHRINRHAYGFMPGYARMMPEAYRVWDAMWKDIGATHYEETGGIFVLRREDEWYGVTVATLDELGIWHRDIPIADLPDRLPMIKPDGVKRVLETGGQGLLFNIRILTDLVVRLAARGVRFHTSAPVTDVNPDRGEVRVGGTIHAADVVVVTAGAWVGRLMPELNTELVPSRQAVVYLAPPPRMAEAWARSPIIIVRAETGLYTLPPRRGTRLKIGDHSFSRTGDADDDRTATPADTDVLWTAARKAYRDIEAYTVLEQKACYYTVTADEGFVVRPSGGRGWVISACSGHGFKLAPLIGDGVARAIVGEVDPSHVPAWAAGRGVLA